MVVLAMITKNSSERIAVFPQVLKSSLQVPYKAIILVDDSDTDKTVSAVRKFAEEHGKELIVSRSRLPPGWSKPTRATARQTAVDIFFENTSDEWLMFLDDDCVLRSGWWSWIADSGVLEKPNVGEVWGVNWDATDDRKRYLEVLGIDYVKYLVDAFERRGGTHDTLYRRAAIEGVRIPPELHIYEDAWLHHYVRCSGWKSVINPIGVSHFSITGDSFDKERWLFAIRTALKYGISELEPPRGRLRAYLSLLRPIAGFPLMVSVYARLYPLPRAIAIAARRQYAKLWVRWIFLWELEKAGWRIPDVCSSVRP
ncbi:MAG: glycosyltransferase family 2 protein [Pyrobaculum arsenaticum]|uniref:glycosyltransferase n=1 Tax=Pyrobaculum arsenaticum TaxID=121277 RepID=UPI002276EB65|nr:glycosyltransferase family 2 protein [Pyrobaculum arsenaticum]